MKQQHEEMYGWAIAYINSATGYSILSNFRNNTIYAKDQDEIIDAMYYPEIIKEVCFSNYLFLKVLRNSMFWLRFERENYDIFKFLTIKNGDKRQLIFLTDIELCNLKSMIEAKVRETLSSETSVIIGQIYYINSGLLKGKNITIKSIRNSDKTVQGCVHLFQSEINVRLPITDLLII